MAVLLTTLDRIVAVEISSLHWLDGPQSLSLLQARPAEAPSHSADRAGCLEGAPCKGVNSQTNLFWHSGGELE
jgi:hypothetical protein